ncbi:hypothetical protein EGW08_000785, partial [Elysia chlorotica]
GGEQERIRLCDDPEPTNGGKDCEGSLRETMACNTQQCPIDGGEGEWSEWSSCTVTCGGGTRNRQRACDNPTPSLGGQECAGAMAEVEECNNTTCPREYN